MRPRLSAVLPALIALAAAVTMSASNPRAARATEAAVRPDLVLILDASGSMWGQIQGENKIVIARRVLADVLAKVPDTANVGLVAYGHRREADCNDIEIVVPVGAIDHAAIVKRINALNPKGKTPITASLNLAFDDVAKRDRPATVVLVSDGLETCNADPCQAVRDAKAKGIKFVMHVIGFDVGGVDVSQLECAAQAGGGLYLGASDAGQFTDALAQAVAMTPESPTGKLSVKATNNGELIDVMIEVKRAGSAEVVANGRTYESGDSNPRIIPLDEGSYDIEVTAVAINGSPRKTVTGITIENGKTVETAVEFSSGKLRVEALRDGALTDAAVAVRAAGTQEQIAGGRTYDSAATNPLEIELPAGTYDVVVKSVTIEDSAEIEWPGIVIAGGDVVEKSADFSSGKLRVKVTRNGALADATVSVLRPGTREQVAGGRTYVGATTNPLEIELATGLYDVEIGSVEIAGKPTHLWESIVVGGENVAELEHEFTSGTLRVGATQAGQLIDAAVQIRGADNVSVGGGRTYKDTKSNPKTFTLAPGTYAISLAPVKRDVGAERKLTVTVNGGGTTEEIVDFAQ